jgi:hypothetical protein
MICESELDEAIGYVLFDFHSSSLR